jgi:hypothetical protein
MQTPSFDIFTFAIDVNRGGFGVDFPAAAGLLAGRYDMLPVPTAK